MGLVQRLLGLFQSGLGVGRLGLASALGLESLVSLITTAGA